MDILVHGGTPISIFNVFNKGIHNLIHQWCNFTHAGIFELNDDQQLFGMNYKEGNNRPPSVNQISLVHNHGKAGNKCSYTRDNALKLAQFINQIKYFHNYS